MRQEFTMPRPARTLSPLLAALALSGCMGAISSYRPSIFDDPLIEMCRAEPGSPFCGGLSPSVIDCPDGKGVCIKSQPPRPTRKGPRRQRA